MIKLEYKNTTRTLIVGQYLHDSLTKPTSKGQDYWW
jgi:hypothetical protein